MGGPRPERFRTEPRPSTTLWVRPDRSRRSTSRSHGGEARARGQGKDHSLCETSSESSGESSPRDVSLIVSRRDAAATAAEAIRLFETKGNIAAARTLHGFLADLQIEV